MAKKLTVTELLKIWNSSTNPQLKVLLKERGLPVSGNGDVLLERLLHHTIDNCETAEEILQKAGINSGFGRHALEIIVNKGCKNAEKHLLELLRYSDNLELDDRPGLGEPVYDLYPRYCVEKLTKMGAYEHIPEILHRISTLIISSINDDISNQFADDTELAATGYSSEYWKNVELGSMTMDEYLDSLQSYHGSVTHFWNRAGLDEGAIPKIIDYLKIAHKDFKENSSKITVSYDPDNSYSLNRKKKHFTCNCDHFKHWNRDWERGGVVAVTPIREGTPNEHRGYACGHIHERIYRVLFSIQALGMICMSNSVRLIKLRNVLYDTLLGGRPGAAGIARGGVSEFYGIMAGLSKKEISSLIDSLISKVEQDKVNPVKEISEMLASKSIDCELGDWDKYFIEGGFNRYPKPENPIAPEILKEVKETLEDIVESKRTVNDDITSYSFFIYDCSIERADKAVNNAAILALSLI